MKIKLLPKFILSLGVIGVILTIAISLSAIEAPDPIWKIYMHRG